MTTKQMIEVLQAFEEKKQIQKKYSSGEWRDIFNPTFNFDKYDFRVKPFVDMEFVVDTWVRKTTANEGDYVCFEGCNKEYEIYHIRRHSVVLRNNEGIISSINDEKRIGELFLSSRKKEYVPFTWEDRELFRDKWVRMKCTPPIEKNEHKIVFISHDRTFTCANWSEPVEFSVALRDYEFIDGTPFGKIKP